RFDFGERDAAAVKDIENGLCPLFPTPSLAPRRLPLLPQPLPPLIARPHHSIPPHLHRLSIVQGRGRREFNRIIQRPPFRQPADRAVCGDGGQLVRTGLPYAASQVEHSLS